jgi:predicted ATP-dependent protease
VAARLRAWARDRERAGVEDEGLGTSASGRRAAAPFEEPSADEARALTPIFEGIDRVDLRASEASLLRELAGGRLRSSSARALGAAAQGLVMLFGRNDAHGALGLLLPYLADVDRYPRSVALRLHMLAAHVFSCADGRLFDLGRVRSHVERAEACLPPDAGPDLRFMVRHPEVLAAVMSADAGLVQHTLSRCDPLFDHVREPLTQCLALELRAHAATFEGQATLSSRHYDQLVAAAEPLGFAYGIVRASAFAALHRADDWGEPQRVVALTERAREWSVRAGLRPGVHALYLAASEGDAWLRLGELDRAEGLLRDGLALAADLAWSPVPLVFSFARVLLYRGHFDEARAFAGSLMESEATVQRSLTRAYGRFLAAFVDLSMAEKPSACAHAFDRVIDETRAAGGWPFLEREAAMAGYAARIATAGEAGEDASLRRCERMLLRMPAKRSTAWLARMRALHALKAGIASDALHFLQEARLAYERMGDVPEVLLTDRALALASLLLRQEDATERMAKSVDAFARLGLVAPRLLEPTHIDAASGLALRGSTGDRFVEVRRAVARIAAPGNGLEAIEAELLRVCAKIVPGGRFAIETLSSVGDEEVRSSRGDGDATAQWEYPSGVGESRRLVLVGSLEAEAPSGIEVLVTVASLACRLAARHEEESPVSARIRDTVDGDGDTGFVAASPAMRALRLETRRLAASKATVIINGESGAGKELVARAVHDASTRAAGPFVTLNCAAVPKDLFESQLFGHKRGSFTGASADAPGVLRSADGGTVFLDEIGELPLDVQPKLLRFLENAEVLPVGAARPTRVDVRVVAATHRDLLKLVHEGSFREDLYYRLQVIPLRVPPLRERPEDIVAIARVFLARLTEPGQVPPRLTPDAVAKLVGYAWPGNVRELRNVIDRVMAFAPRPDVIRAEHVKLGR